MFALGAGSVPEHAHALVAAFECIHEELPAEVRARLGAGAAAAAACIPPGAAAGVEAGGSGVRLDSRSSADRAREKGPGSGLASAAALPGRSRTAGMSPRDAFFAEVEQCARL